MFSRGCLLPDGGRSGLGGGGLGFGFAPGLVAGQDFVAGQLIVGYKAGAPTAAAVSAAQAAGGKVSKTISGAGAAVLIDFGSDATALAAVPKLLKLSNVRYVERNGILRLPPQPTLTPPPKPGLNSAGKRAAGDLSSASVSTDPGGGFQYHLAVIRKTAALPALSATPPTVAVIDTDVDYAHPDLAGKVILGLNAITNNSNPFDDNEHGTHVAGIIAAKGGNGAYGEGVCPTCKILAVKVLDATGSGTDFDVALGMAWTVTNRNTTTPPTKVVNMSLGGAASATIAEQVLAMKNAGMVLVAAAGNDNTTSTTDAFPGADPNVALRVMATEQQDCRAWFSNFSPAAMPGQYNIAAPVGISLRPHPKPGYAPDVRHIHGEPSGRRCGGLSVGSDCQPHS